MARARWQARYDRERRDWRHSLVWCGRAIAACAMALGAGIVLLGLGLMGALLP